MAATCGGVGRPESFICADGVIDPTAPDEEGVAQTVEIADGFFGDAFGAGESDEKTFGTATDGAADVKVGVEAAATGEDERTQGSEDGVGLIDFVFELGDLGVGDARLFGMNVFGQSGEDGAEVEEFVLNTFEDDGEGRDGGKRFCGNAGGADEGVEFIDGAVGFDAEVVFGDALAAHEGGVAGVAGAGVDAVEGEAGLVESGFAHKIEFRW